MDSGTLGVRDRRAGHSVSRGQRAARDTGTPVRVCSLLGLTIIQILEEVFFFQLEEGVILDKGVGGLDIRI